ncbi:hypothetical protein Tco_0858108 [Tanacetum coccineum]|uniref:Uncharacterized protein n=1 Tax=Tanacetum coccineum TaxID=301880 RepID=A0ABQ5B8Y7_9ASTR
MDSAASLRSCLASKIKSIDCTIKGKDGKPTKAFRNVSFEASKPDGCSRRPARYNGTKKPQSANISSTEVQGKNGMNDGINIMTLKNSFKSLMEANKVLDVQPNDVTQNPKYVVEDEDDDVEEVFVEDPRAGNGKHTDNA